MTLHNILVDMTIRAGLDPADWTVPDVKISGYIIPKYFGRREAAEAVRRMAVTFTFGATR